MKVKKLIDSLQEMMDKGQITEETQVLLNTYDDCMYEVACVEPLGEFIQIEAWQMREQTNLGLSIMSFIILKIIEKFLIIQALLWNRR
ncbi:MULTISPECIES: hypothetical protein [Bacillus]|uniref:hypothetical protein n=1 Tax=Bacillus TaxID=1386 RepID=UPI001C001461|nr:MULTISPECIES: hypothetical protein [Bacillus]MBT9285915.1 hypothetical protein [Bacillus velezensis]MCX2820266.1 hypothetical protein [Bacillus sp. H1F1]MED3230842.1 hypothetical protein [Bacillus velezensis]QWK23525.1 hypothetical protein KM776_11345 [Bacillus velezensis]